MAALLLVSQGCGSLGKSTISSSQSISLKGTVHGGQQPIVHATIQLYAVSQNGVGTNAIPLIRQATTTDSDGGFSLAGVDACPSNTVPVYLVSRGGNPGLFTGSNSAIALMAALGPCGNLDQVLGVTLNEVTTVAAVYALAPFMNSYSQVGTAPGLESLFANSWSQASELADIHKGTAPGPNADLSSTAVPVAKINSIANMLAACINSAGDNLGAWSLCGQLFSYTNDNGTTPTDTIGAVLQMARNPTNHVGNLFSLLAPLAPFEPQLPRVPADWGLLSSVGIPLASPPVVAPAPVPDPPVVTPAPIPDPAPPAPMPDPPVVPPAPVPDPPVVTPTPVPDPPVVTPTPSPDPPVTTPIVTPPGPGVTWYIRKDGAPHYESRFESSDYQWRGNPPTHTCDGKHDAPWPAIGTMNALGVLSNGRNQPCALADWRNLYDDQYSYGSLAWIISGGDTVILDNTQAWRVGTDGANGTSGSEPWCWGGDTYSCSNPKLPSGTAQQHTRILGRNWANCSTNNQPDKAKMSEIFGGHGVYQTLNLAGAQYVDIECLNVTRHSQCIKYGTPTPANSSGCHTGLPVDDYSQDGLKTDNLTHDLLIQDVWAHGFVGRGIIGAVGGLITANRVDIDTNGSTGWDFDDGRVIGGQRDSTPSDPSAMVVAHYLTIEWSGCNQEYPAIHAVPVASCYGQSNGGQGDGLGTPDTGISFAIDHATFRYNVQEGLDVIHVDQGKHSLTITDSASYFNGGQAYKWGVGMSSVYFANNIAVTGCERMAHPIPGVSAAYNANLQDFCRAYDSIAMVFPKGGHTKVYNSTFITYAPTAFDIGCGASEPDCSDTTLDFANNVVIGYDNPSTYPLGGRNGGGGGWNLTDTTSYTANGQPIGRLTRSHNLWSGFRNTGPGTYSGIATAESDTGEITGIPLLNQPTGNGVTWAYDQLDGMSFALSPGSVARSAGAPIADGPTTDFTGAPIDLVAPSLGALEAGSSWSLPRTLP